MRFDDRLQTVLAQPAANPHDRAVRWRQLVELLARASDLSTPLAQRALEVILADAGRIDQQLRAAAARAVARPQLPLRPGHPVRGGHGRRFGACAGLRPSLQPFQWRDVLATASPDSQRFIRSLYPDLPAWGAAQPLPPEPVRSREAGTPQPEPTANQSAAGLQNLSRART